MALLLGLLLTPLDHEIDHTLLLRVLLGLPIVQVELKGRVIQAGTHATGGPLGDCTPPVVGLSGVTRPEGKIHEGERLGHAVLSTFSGSASTVRLGGSRRRIFAERACLHFRLLAHVQHLCMELMNLCFVGRLLRHLILPLRLEQFWL